MNEWPFSDLIYLKNLIFLVIQSKVGNTPALHVGKQNPTSHLSCWSEGCQLPPAEKGGIDRMMSAPCLAVCNLLLFWFQASFHCQVHHHPRAGLYSAADLQGRGNHQQQQFLHNWLPAPEQAKNCNSQLRSECPPCSHATPGHSFIFPSSCKHRHSLIFHVFLHPSSTPLLIRNIESNKAI